MCQGLATSPRIGAGVERMIQRRSHDRPRRQTPHELTTVVALWQFHVMPPQFPQHGVSAAQRLERLEEPSHGRTDLLVRIEHDGTVRQEHVAPGHGMKQLAAQGLVPPSAFQSTPHNMEFHLTDDAFHTKNQSIVDVARIVDAIVVSQQRVTNGT